MEKDSENGTFCGNGENRAFCPRWDTFCDNAVIHFYPLSPFIGKCSVNIRKGEKIVLRVVMRDEPSAHGFLARAFCGIPTHTIVHC